MKKKKQQKQDGSQIARRDATKPPPPEPSTGTPKMAGPSPETLAMIAATLAKGVVGKPATAIANAAALYDAACDHLESKARVLATRQMKAKEKATLPVPKKFPATFNDVLKFIVSGRPEDKKHRFKQYLRDDLTRFYTESVPVEPLPAGEQCDPEAGKKRDAFVKEHKPTRPRPTWVRLDAWKHLDELKSKGKTKQLAEAIEKQVVPGLENYQLGILEATWFWLMNDYRQWWAGKKSALARAAAIKSKRTS